MRYTGEYSVFKDRQRIRVVNLIKSYITNGEADTSRRKGKSAYDSIQTEQLKKELDRFITILEEEPLRPNTIYTYKRIVAYLLIYCENSKYLFVRELAPFTRLNGEGSSIRVVLLKMEALAGISNACRISGSRMTRHNAASSMLRSGVPMADISAVLGHTDPNIVSVYLSTDETIMAACTLPLPQEVHTNE